MDKSTQELIRGYISKADEKLRVETGCWLRTTLRTPSLVPITVPSMQRKRSCFLKVSRVDRMEAWCR